MLLLVGKNNYSFKKKRLQINNAPPIAVMPNDPVTPKPR